MARATRYTVIVQPGIQTEDGATLAVPFTHTFLTQRPKVTEVMPPNLGIARGSSAPGTV